MCINSYYKNSKPYCKHTNDICGFVKWCPKENRWIVSERSDLCKMYNKPVVKIPKGMNRVRFVKNNNLYIELEDSVIKLPNPFDYEPEMVTLVNVMNNWYIKGFEPKIEVSKPKKTKE